MTVQYIVEKAYWLGEASDISDNDPSSMFFGLNFQQPSKETDDRTKRSYSFDTLSAATTKAEEIVAKEDDGWLAYVRIVERKDVVIQTFELSGKYNP